MAKGGLHILFLSAISGYLVEHPIIWYIPISILYYNLEYNDSNAISLYKFLKKVQKYLPHLKKKEKNIIYHMTLV